MVKIARFCNVKKTLSFRTHSAYLKKIELLHVFVDYELCISTVVIVRVMQLLIYSLHWDFSSAFSLDPSRVLFAPQAEALVKAQQDMGETMGELGLAFIKLAKFETEEAIFDSQRARAADTKCVATAAVKASRLYRELNAQTVKHLVRI